MRFSRQVKSHGSTMGPTSCIAVQQCCGSVTVPWQCHGWHWNVQPCVAQTCGTPGFEWPLDLVSRWWSALSEDSWTIAMCSNMSHSRSSNNIARQNALLSGKDAGNRTSSL